MDVESGDHDVVLTKADVTLRDLDVVSRLSDVGLPNSDIHLGQTDILLGQTDIVPARTDILPRPISSRDRRLRAENAHHAGRRLPNDCRSAITGGGALKSRIALFDQTEVAR